MKSIRCRVICALLVFSLCGLGLPALAADRLCPADMQFIEGGTFRIGSNSERPEEQAASAVTLSAYCIDRYETTNQQFARFVKETGYVTVAERALSREQFPDLSGEDRSPGSLVFAPPTESGPIPYLRWWKWTPGANWRHPTGPGSNLSGLDRYPVVHVAFDDVVAYANWAGKSLPTEAQWEFAARGGSDSTYGWGDRYSSKKANTWQGIFPITNTKEDGYLGTAPVGSFPANAFGLYDTIGNVWEWTADWYRAGHSGKDVAYNPAGPSQSDSFDPREPSIAKHVIKGGSYLCAKNYCSRYRPSAREAQSSDTGTSHVGFRLVKNLEQNPT
ncbi:MAG: formylglycine-generating enzyme family protein [Synechococcus sp.]